MPVSVKNVLMVEKAAGCHGCTHVVGVAHAQVNYFSDSTAPDVGGLVRGATTMSLRLWLSTEMWEYAVHRS